MAKASPIQTSFNAGEFSPLLDARIDVDKYGSACSTLENFIPLVQGPARRRPGTKYVAEVKDSADRTWLMPFVFSSTQAFMLEFGDGYIRFYTSRAQLGTGVVAAYNGGTAYTVGDMAASGGVSYYCIAATTGNAPPNATYWYPLTADIYEIPSPYALADLTNSDGAFALDFWQTGDVIYITHPEYAPRKLQRFANTRWILSLVDLDGGPFQDLNTTSTTIYAASATGTGVTFTASASAFELTDVGSWILLESKAVDDTRMWEPAKAVALGDDRRVGNRVYDALTAGTTGAVQPVHTEGAAFDGEAPGAIQWQFLHAGFGYAEIVGYTSATVVTADIVDRIPDMAVGAGNPTTKWALSAFSDTEGWPSHVCFFRERLTFSKDQTIYTSVAGDFENFKDRDNNGLVVADSAITIDVTSAQANEIQWLAPLDRLLIGTTGSEMAAGEITTSDPLGPANMKVDQQSNVGSRSVKPQIVQEAVLYVQRSGTKIREATYNFDINGYQTRDMNVFAEHVGAGGINQIAYQAEPWSVAWCVRGDGQLLGLTYNREQNVYGWHRHILGGPFGSGAAVVESVACIPAPDNDRDDLWLIVKRTVNGATQRYVEYITTGYETGSALEDAIYMDSAVTYDGVATTTVSGLGHLEGQTVTVLADGATHPDCVVASGAITLARSASVVQVGLGYTSTLRTMRLEAGAKDGTAQGKTKRITQVTFRLNETLGLKAGPSASTLDIIPFRTSADQMGNPPAVFTGDKRMPWPNGYDTDAYVTIVQDQPLPMTVVAIMPQVVTQDRG